MNKFISEEKQALPLAGLDPAFNFVGAAVTKKTGDVAFGGRGFAAAHKQFEHVLPDNFLFLQARIFFT